MDEHHHLSRQDPQQILVDTVYIIAAGRQAIYYQ
jgi:hypothetical protein